MEKIYLVHYWGRDKEKIFQRGRARNKREVKRKVMKRNRKDLEKEKNQKIKRKER